MTLPPELLHQAFADSGIHKKKVSCSAVVKLAQKIPMTQEGSCLRVSIILELLSYSQSFIPHSIKKSILKF